MGPKASTPEKPPVSAVVEPLEEAKSTSPPNRNIRSAYLKRIGIGGRASALKGTTLREFKVPKWLEQYSGEEEALSDNETLQNIASNESYNLNFIQVKSNDEIRMGLLRKMSKAGFWKPPSERPPSAQTIIIFDWDDTLLCTSYLNSREDAMNIQDSAILTQLQTLESAASRLLTKAKNLGHLYIITNAMKGWVEYSSSLWLPNLQPVLATIRVISARTEYEQMYPDNYHEWKKQAFLEMTSLFDTSTVTNLVALGDSNIEMDAAKTLASCYNNACIKTIKFRESPRPEELVKQIELVSEKFETICTSAKNMTIRLERKASH